MATVFEPIRPVPPMTTIFMISPPLPMTGELRDYVLQRRPARRARQDGHHHAKRVREVVDAARGLSPNFKCLESRRYRPNSRRVALCPVTAQPAAPASQIDVNSSWRPPTRPVDPSECSR